MLGLLREDNAAARALDSFDVTHEEVRAQVARIVGQGDEVVTTGQIPFTPRAKKVLELSLREALSNGSTYIGPEHILLGLVREGEGVAARILTDFGPLESVRAAALDADAATRTGGFTPESPPLAAEVIEELRRVRAAREKALEEQQFDRASLMRDREQRLTQAARNLQRAWGNENPVYLLEPPAFASRVTQSGREATPWRAVPPVFVGWLLFAVALGIGLLIGWSIWGQ